MRVFDFDGTIYDGESLFDLYMFSARYEPKVLRHLAPVLRYAVQYKMGRATLAQMERGVGGVTCDYLHDVAASRRILRLGGAAPDAGLAGEAAIAEGVSALVNEFWNRHMDRIKPWYEPRPDDVILTASFDVTVGEACRRLGLNRLVSSTVDPRTMRVTCLNFNTNKPKRFRGSRRPGHGHRRVLHRQPVRPAGDRHGENGVHGQRQPDHAGQMMQADRQRLPERTH